MKNEGVAQLVYCASTSKPYYLLFIIVPLLQLAFNAPKRSFTSQASRPSPTRSEERKPLYEEFLMKPSILALLF